MGGVVDTVKQIGGAAVDPFNITGYGGIPGVNSGGNGLIGAINGADAADSAVRSQTAAANSAMGTVKSAYDDTKTQLHPWQQTGVSALGQLAGNNFMEGFQGSPGMQFQLDQAQQATNANMAARGLGNSGAALKALQDRAQGIANQNYQQEYSNQFNRLNALAGYGSNAAGNMANAATGYGANVAGIQTGLGNAQAAASMAKGQGVQNMIGQGVGIAALFSDRRLKKEIASHDSRAFLESLKNYRYRYKNADHGQGEKFGPMAQDLQGSAMGSSLILETDIGKQIDIGRSVMAILGALGDINDRLKNLEGGQREAV